MQNHHLSTIWENCKREMLKRIEAVVMEMERKTQMEILF
jgi:hypothetical protein